MYAYILYIYILCIIYIYIPWRYCWCDVLSIFLHKTLYWLLVYHVRRLISLRTPQFHVIPKIKILFPSDIFHQKVYQSFGGYIISQHFAIHCDAKITRVQHVYGHAGAGFWCNNRCNAFPHLSRSSSVNHDVLRPEMFSTNRLCDHGVDATTWFAHMRLHQVLMHLQTSLCCVFQKNL